MQIFNCTLELLFLTEENIINSSVADPDSGSGAFLTPGSGIRGSWMGKKSRSGSGIWNGHPGSYFQELRNNFLGYKYLNSLMRIRIRDPRSGSFLTLEWIRDGKIRIRNKHPGSATLKSNCHENSQKCTIHKLTSSSMYFVLHYIYCMEYSTYIVWESFIPDTQMNAQPAP
jgi:hypothetical protein